MNAGCSYHEEDTLSVLFDSIAQDAERNEGCEGNDVTKELRLTIVVLNLFPSALPCGGIKLAVEECFGFR